MVGVTKRHQGESTVSLTSILNKPWRVLEVDMASLDTGIALRNEHMRREIIRYCEIKPFYHDEAVSVGTR